MSSALQTDTWVDQYFHEIEDSVGLSAKDEIEIAKRIKDGDEIALSSLVKANLRFVVSVAKQYQNLGLPLSDLINEGNMGLMVAAKRLTKARCSVRRSFLFELCQGHAEQALDLVTMRA